MASWVDLVNFAPGQLLGSDDANQILENARFLRSPARHFYQRGFGDANYTTTSTTFVNIDGTNMDVELQTFGGPVRVELHCRIDHTTNAFAHFDIIVDGVSISNDTNGVYVAATNATGLGISFSRLIPLAAGLHTFALQWRTSTGTLTMEVNGLIQFEIHEEY